MTQSEDDIANRLLLSLPKASLNRLLPALELRTTAEGDVINRVDRPVEHYYFLNRGLISLVKLMEDGRSVEIGVIGIEGMTSPHTLFGFNRAAIEAIVQIPGSAFRIRSDLLRQLITEDDVLHETLARYANFAFSAMAQTAAFPKLPVSWLLGPGGPTPGPCSRRLRIFDFDPDFRGLPRTPPVEFYEYRRNFSSELVVFRIDVPKPINQFDIFRTKSFFQRFNFLQQVIN